MESENAQKIFTSKPIIDVLLRHLPLKERIRFRQISKVWKNTIEYYLKTRKSLDLAEFLPEILNNEKRHFQQQERSRFPQISKVWKSTIKTLKRLDFADVFPQINDKTQERGFLGAFQFFKMRSPNLERVYFPTESVEPSTQLELISMIRSLPNYDNLKALDLKGFSIPSGDSDCICPVNQEMILPILSTVEPIASTLEEISWFSLNSCLTYGYSYGDLAKYFRCQPHSAIWPRIENIFSNFYCLKTLDFGPTDGRCGLKLLLKLPHPENLIRLKISGTAEFLVSFLDQVQSTLEHLSLHCAASDSDYWYDTFWQQGFLEYGHTEAICNCRALRKLVLDAPVPKENLKLILEKLNFLEEVSMSWAPGFTEEHIELLSKMPDLKSAFLPFFRAPPPSPLWFPSLKSLDLIQVHLSSDVEPISHLPRLERVRVFRFLEGTMEDFARKLPSVSITFISDSDLKETLPFGNLASSPQLDRFHLSQLS